jgi:hypothetical protein
MKTEYDEKTCMDSEKEEKSVRDNVVPPSLEIRGVTEAEGDKAQKVAAPSKKVGVLSF